MSLWLIFTCVSTREWLRTVEIIDCPKEPYLGIWAANLGHAKHQPNFALKLSHLGWSILRCSINVLSPQNCERIIIVSTVSCHKVVFQAHGANASVTSFHATCPSPHVRKSGFGLSDLIRPYKVIIKLLACKLFYWQEIGRASCRERVCAIV